MGLSLLDAFEDSLRYYQLQAVDAVRASLQKNRSTMLVIATGLGKTEIGCKLAWEWPGNVLWLAHRDELVIQARRRLEKMTGEWVDLEKAAISSHKARLVVGSVQTVQRKKRLEALGKDRFDLIVFDECQHAPAATFRKPLDYFSKAKVLGLTATPDRQDKRALGQIFDDVAMTLGIQEGIEAGFLVDIRGKVVNLKEINLSRVKKSKGDLAVGQLDEAMIKAVEGVCKKTIELEPNRQAIVFWPGVKSAEFATHKLNVLRPGSAICITADTHENERRLLVTDFKAGKFQYLCNVQVATEGFDAPSVDLIVQARPTLSRALYSQMIGRGTRVLPGVIDGYGEASEALERQKLIKASAKPDLMVLDFVGNSGKHNLCTVVDALGGNYDPAVIKRARKKAKESPGANIRQLLEEAQKELEELAQTQKAEVVAEVVEFDPFQTLGINTYSTDRYNRRHGVAHKPPTGPQINALKRWGFSDNELLGLTRRHATKLISELIIRKDKKLATYRQLKRLRDFGITKPQIPFNRASEALDYLSETGWGRKNYDPGVLNHLINAPRMMGEEG